MAGSLTPGMIAADIAQAFVDARCKGGSLSAFPGPYPADLDEAYAIQKAAIASSPRAIAGWKVGRLTPDLAERFGVDRFIGPIFQGDVQEARDGADADFPMFVGGSAAFEAEYMLVLGRDDTASGAAHSAESASALVGAVRIGIEVAGSPLATMPQCDSLASIADFGNNNGAILGAEVPLSALDDPAQLECGTVIDDQLIRSASAADLPGGPLTAFAFALNMARELGHPLRAGQFVSTGAVTGMHPVRIGQHGLADFGRWGWVACLVVPVGRA